MPKKFTAEVLPRPVLLSVEWGVNLCNMTCGFCGASADIGEFCCTAVNGEMPRDCFQCPKCHSAWRVVRGKITSYKDRLTGQVRFNSQPNTIEAIQSVL